MPLRTLIVCTSVHHQNTAKVAHMIANTLHADVCDPSDFTAERLSHYELFGFGSGVYFGQFHATLRQRIIELPDDPLAHRKAFVFSTEGLPCLFRFWHWPIKSLLMRKGFDIVGEFHCRGFDTVGPLWLFGGINRRHPDSRDLEKAAVFARRLLSQFSKEGPTNSSTHNI